MIKPIILIKLLTYEKCHFYHTDSLSHQKPRVLPLMNAETWHTGRVWDTIKGKNQKTKLFFLQDLK